MKTGYVLRAGRGVSARTSAVTFEGIGSFHISGNAGHGPPRIPLRAVLHVSGNAGHGPPRRPLRKVHSCKGERGSRMVCVYRVNLCQNSLPTWMLGKELTRGRVGIEVTGCRVVHTR